MSDVVGLIKTFSDAGYKWVSKYSCNQKRDLFVAFSRDGVLEKFYIKFRKDISFDSEGSPIGFFLTFGKQFPKFFEENKELGYIGESINVETLNSAIIKKVNKIVFCYADGRMYWIYPQLLKRFSEKHNLIRGQTKFIYKNSTYVKNGEPTHEITYSVPLGLLKKLDLGRNNE